MAHPAGNGTWSLGGRVAELALIEEARRETCGVVISAEEGVGKSRVGREALAAAERDGAYTAWVQATRSAAMVPLGAFAGLLPETARADDVLDLLRTSALALRERAGRRPIVLGVDDAHLLDPASAALVLHLATHASVFVIATVRTGDPCPDAIASLWKDAGARRLELERLSDEVVRGLVEAALGAPVEQEALIRLSDRSQGNPLYVHELVLGAVDAGALAFEGELWRLSGELPLSASLAELVERRLAELTSEQRAPIELLAFSEPLRLPEIASLTSYDALADAEARGLISVDSHIRLAHPLYGEALRAQVPALRARALRLQLAEALQAREPLAGDDALRVVRLLLDAGAQPPSALLVSAARAANHAGDPELGARLAELAGPGVPAALVLARAYAMRRRFADAEAALAAVENDPDAHTIPYLEQRLRVLYWGFGDVDATRSLLDRAQTWFEDPRTLVPLRLLVITADDLAGAIAGAEALLADPELDAETRRLLEPRFAVRLLYAGRWNEALGIARRHRPAIPMRTYTELIALSVYRFLAVSSGLDWPALRGELEQILADGVREGDHEAAGQAALGLGHLDFMRGALRDATRWLTEAALHFEREDVFGFMVQVQTLLVGIAQLRGDAAAAEAAAARVREGVPARPDALWRTAYDLRAEGWALAVRNPAAGAGALLAGAERLAATSPGFAALLAYDALLAGAAPARVDAFLRDVAPRCDARLVDAYAAHAAALAARDGEALLTVADAFEAIGAHRYAMNAAVHAASVFLAAARQDSARRAAARATDLHVPDQGTEPPQIDGLDRIAIALTAREAQLVALARKGQTNAQIADQLVLSVRTVEAHLYRAMQKLGVNDRRDL